MKIVSHDDDPIIWGVNQEEFDALVTTFKTVGATLDDVGDDNFLLIVDGWTALRLRRERRQ